MVFDEFFQSADRLMKTLNRPDWKTYWLTFKIVFAGIGIVGGIGFIIKLIAVTLQGGAGVLL
jgi:protein translocase SEC61 complex gamma subunit